MLVDVLAQFARSILGDRFAGKLTLVLYALDGLFETSALLIGSFSVFNAEGSSFVLFSVGHLHAHRIRVSVVSGCLTGRREHLAVDLLS